jgi:hypothetical protein
MEMDLCLIGVRMCMLGCLIEFGIAINFKNNFKRFYK